jgi:hypothetical protein
MARAIPDNEFHDVISTTKAVGMFLEPGWRGSELLDVEKGKEQRWALPPTE